MYIFITRFFFCWNKWTYQRITYLQNVLLNSDLTTDEVFLSSTAGILWALRYWRRLASQSAPNIHRQHLLCSAEERKILKIIRYQFQRTLTIFSLIETMMIFCMTSNPPPPCYFCYAVRDCILLVVNHFFYVSPMNQIYCELEYSSKSIVLI